MSCAMSAILSRLSAQKPAVEREHMAVVNERYDLTNRPAAGVTMDRTKPVQEGVRVKLVSGTTWDSLAGERERAVEISPNPGNN